MDCNESLSIAAPPSTYNSSPLSAITFWHTAFFFMRLAHCLLVPKIRPRTFRLLSLAHIDSKQCSRIRSGSKNIFSMYKKDKHIGNTISSSLSYCQLIIFVVYIFPSPYFRCNAKVNNSSNQTLRSVEKFTLRRNVFTLFFFK